jgi:phage baseplate assembly protein W
MSHFDYPFKFSPYTLHAAEVQQDSLDDIANCVQVALATELGFRVEVPSFGVPDQTFLLAPMTLETLIQSVSNWESRVNILLAQIAVPNDPINNRVSAIVALRKVVGE